MNLSYWERENFLHYNYLVIGSGITGLSIACELMERYPKSQIAVLERGILPSGASTKNAGFACTGSLSEHVSDLDLMGPDRLVQLVANRRQGLSLLKRRLGEKEICFEQKGGFELILKNQDSNFLNRMDEVNQLLKPIFKKVPFGLKSHRIKEFGFSDRVEELVFNETEGQIDTGKMMDRLWKYAQSLGIRIITGAKVLKIEEESGKVRAILNEAEFTGEKIFVATNAFTRSLISELELQPGRGQVIITKPVRNLRINGIYFLEEGFYYFKDQDGRVLLGGGRNLDFSGEETTEFGSNQRIISHLETLLKEIILPKQDFEIDQSWSGIMAFGGNKQPHLQQVGDRTYIAARLNGMGIALGSKLAKDLVNLAIG